MLLVKINVRCLLVLQSALYTMNSVDLKILLYNVLKRFCIMLTEIYRVLYCSFSNKHCLIQLSCPFLASYSGI